MLIAGVLGQTDLRLGLSIAAGLTAFGILFVGWIPRTPTILPAARPVLLHPVRQGEWGGTSPQRAYYRLNLGTVRQLGSSLHSPFGVFLIAWLASFAGAAAVFSLYPVLMQQSYGIAPALSSSGFAVAAGLGLALYSPAGSGSNRWGAARVLQIALWVRVLAFLSLLGWGLLLSFFVMGLPC